MRPFARAASSAAVVLALAAAAGSLVGCGKGGGAALGPAALWEGAAIRDVARGRKLVVLTEATFAPFEWRDEKGEIRGFDVDLARALAKELQGEGGPIEVEFVDRGFAELMGELNAGRAHLLISGMTITGPRAVEVSFSDPYFLTRTFPLVSNSIAADVKRVDDLNDAKRRIVAKLGTTGETAAKSRLPRATLVSLDVSEATVALEVVQGRADAFVYDEAQVRHYAAQYPGTCRVLDEALTIEPYGIACRKGDVETVAWLNVALDLMRRDGRLDALYDKHGLARPPAPR